MNHKEIIKIINEEISEYNFLNHEAIQEEDNFNAVLNSKDFQVKLVNDIINHSQTIKDWKMDYSSTKEAEAYDNTEDLVDFEFQYSFIYNYNKHDLKLSLDIIGDKVAYDTQGSYKSATKLQPAEFPERIQTHYEDAEVILYDEGGEIINIDWLNKNRPLKYKLIKGIVGEFPEK